MTNNTGIISHFNLCILILNVMYNIAMEQTSIISHFHRHLVQYMFRITECLSPTTIDEQVKHVSMYMSWVQIDWWIRDSWIRAHEYVTHEYVTDEYVTHEYVTHEYVTREYVTREYVTREYVTHEYVTHEYPSVMFQCVSCVWIRILAA